MTRFREHTAAFALLLAITGCTGWSRVSDVPPRQPPAFQQLQIWSNDSSWILSAIRVGDDSLSGVPPGADRACSDCRVAFAMADVDSLRAGGTLESVTLGVGVVAGLVVGFLSLLLVVYSAGGT